MTVSEIHPWQHYIPAGSSTLIIGTFPPTKRNWSYEFFYPNKTNLFWTVMSSIAGVELVNISSTEATAERKAILDKLKVGITDMGLEISRKNNSSLDENLEILQHMDILEILRTHPSIHTLLFTSSSGKASAAKWFIQYLKTKQIYHRFPTGPKPLKSAIKFEGRTINLVILFSPSRRAANRISLERLIEMYKSEIK